MDRAPYVIIGNSTAAIAGIAGIRSADLARPIALIAKETHHAYSRPLISYLLAGKVDGKRMFCQPDDFYQTHGVSAMLGVEATGIDTNARSVRTADGRTIGFEKLLIATGGAPIIPPNIAGTDASGVFTFTTWDDATNIAEYIKRHKVTRALIVGGGLIGLKALEALQANKVASTVVELADRILGAALDRTASDMARAHLERVGVAVRCGTTIKSVTQRNGRAVGAVLSDGSRVKCELVVLAIGVAPDIRIVKGAPIETDRGIIVDDHMRTSVEGIYAAGDVAQADDMLTGVKRPIPIFPNAARQGLVAGCNMAGKERSYAGALAMNAVDVLGLPIISVGIASPEGDEFESISAVESDGLGYRKVVLRNDRIVGAVFVGQIDRAGIITGLIREKINVAGFKDTLLTEEFGLISLPADYRKHVVAGMGVEV